MLMIAKKNNWLQIISYVIGLIMSHVFISKYLSCLERRLITSNDIIAGNGRVKLMIAMQLNLV